MFLYTRLDWKSSINVSELTIAASGATILGGDLAWTEAESSGSRNGLFGLATLSAGGLLMGELALRKGLLLGILTVRPGSRRLSGKREHLKQLGRAEAVHAAKQEGFGPGSRRRAGAAHHTYQETRWPT